MARSPLWSPGQCLCLRPSPSPHFCHTCLLLLFTVYCLSLLLLYLVSLGNTEASEHTHTHTHTHRVWRSTSLGGQDPGHFPTTSCQVPSSPSHSSPSFTFCFSLQNNHSGTNSVNVVIERSPLLCIRSLVKLYKDYDAQVIP